MNNKNSKTKPLLIYALTFFAAGNAAFTALSVAFGWWRERRHNNHSRKGQ